MPCAVTVAVWESAFATRNARRPSFAPYCTDAPGKEPPAPALQHRANGVGFRPHDEPFRTVGSAGSVRWFTRESSRREAEGNGA
jgi:hypothetical protein